MKQDIIIGRYIYGKSFLHNIDPIIKLAVVFLVAISIFLQYSVYLLMILSLGVFFLLILSKIGLRNFIPVIRIAKIFIVFTFFSGLLRYSQEYYYKLFIFTFSEENFYYILMTSYKLIIVVLLSYVFLVTTSFTDYLRMSQSKYLSKKFVMMIILALNFIPSIMEEAQIIIKAQTARGIDFNSSNVIGRVKNYFLIISPLFFSTLKKAETLSLVLYTKVYQVSD